jgi:hypothetical protein
MKKIAFVSVNHFAPWGGSEELWSQVALRMARERFAIEVIVKNWGSREHPRIKDLESAGSNIRRIDNGTIVQRIVNKLCGNKLPHSWLYRFSPDLVVLSLGTSASGIDWIEACQRKKIPFVIIVQSAGELIWPSDYELDKAMAGWKEARRCFFVSRRNIEFCEMQMGTKIENAQIVRNPFNVSFDKPLPWPPASPIRAGYSIKGIEPKKVAGKAHQRLVFRRRGKRRVS